MSLWSDAAIADTIVDWVLRGLPPKLTDPMGWWVIDLVDGGTLQVRRADPNNKHDPLNRIGDVFLFRTYITIGDRKMGYDHLLTAEAVGQARIPVDIVTRVLSHSRHKIMEAVK